MKPAPLDGTRTPEEMAIPFSVMCIDDNALLIDAIERRLSLEPGFTGLHRVDDFAAAVEDAVALKPTIVLLDIDLPGAVDAFEILAGLVRRAPDVRVVVFTGYPSGDLVARSMSIGAWAFLSKGIAGEQLVAAIRQVLAGHAVIDLDD